MAREGLEVADVFRCFGPAFRDQNGTSLSAARWRAMRAIESCRTAALGGKVPVDLEATHSSALEFVSLEDLQAHALK